MNSKKSNKKLMIIITIAVVVLLIVGILGFIIGNIVGGNTNNNKTSIKDLCIGSWKVENNSKVWNTIEIITLYEGGTGKGKIVGKNEKDGYYSLSWEIQDDVINITYGDMFSVTKGFKIENNVIKSVDDQYIYTKVDNTSISNNKPKKEITEITEEMIKNAELLDEEQFIRDVYNGVETAKDKYVGKVYKMHGTASKMASSYDYTRLHITGGFGRETQHAYFQVRFKDTSVKDTITSNDYITIVGQIEDISQELDNSTPFMGTNYQTYRVEGKIKNAVLVNKKEIGK